MYQDDNDGCNKTQHTATYCNTLQHTIATHCNTLQYTTAHYMCTTYAIKPCQDDNDQIQITPRLPQKAARYTYNKKNSLIHI